MNLVVEFKLALVVREGDKPIERGFRQEFEMHGAWNPDFIALLVQEEWQRARVNHMEMFKDEHAMPRRVSEPQF